MNMRKNLLIALGFAAVARVGVGSDADAARGACAPECTQDERDRLSERLVSANVALGIGLGGVALAVVTWFVLGPNRGAAKVAW